MDPTEDLHSDLSLVEDTIVIPHPIADDIHPYPVDLVPPPAPPPPPTPVVHLAPVHDPHTAIMAEGDPMAAFKTAIIETFQAANRNSTYPMPTFAGKKGDKPEDHTLRFEDYCQHYHIEGEHKAQAFVKTLSAKARAWADTTKDAERRLPADEAAEGAPRADIEKTLRHLFLTCFAVQGRTPKALYAEWQNLAYDPAKDNIEDFVRDIKKLAEQLGYGETAALMAVRGALLLELQNMTVTMDDLEAVKELLIKIFDNPKMKQNYRKKETPASTSAAGAFSQTTVIGDPIDKGMSYFLSRMDDLGNKVDKLQI